MNGRNKIPDGVYQSVNDEHLNMVIDNTDSLIISYLFNKKAAVYQYSISGNRITMVSIKQENGAWYGQQTFYDNITIDFQEPSFYLEKDDTRFVYVASLTDLD